jgi:hypothetical protein
MRPRIHLLGAMAVVIIAAAWLGGVALWHHHQDADRQHAYAQAERALDALILPVGLTRGANEDCVPRPGTLCATTALTGQAAISLVMKVLHVDYACNPGTCPPIFGTVGGYSASGFVIEHLRHVTTGTPPPNAVPFGPRQHHLFLVGSYVTLDVANPGA